jgi:hypothetical protein
MKHLTPTEHRTVWILTAVLLLGIAGRIWIRTMPVRSLPPLPHLATNSPAAGPH